MLTENLHSSTRKAAVQIRYNETKTHMSRHSPPTSPTRQPEPAPHLTQENELKYGFVITILELANTIPSLWATAQQFMAENPDLIPKKNLMPLVTAPDGSYNLCHFWSNFEIGDLNFFRSKAYQAYFDHLDR